MRDDAAIVERRAPCVGGIAPFTTIDFPGRLAAVLFMQGCPWRCRHCHNPRLIAAAASPGHREWRDVVGWLRGRRGLLDGVVFSGGEPTAQPAIAEAVREVRALGFEVAIHTAGIYPRRIAASLPLLSWVGLDIKAPAADYEKVTSVVASGRSAFETLDIVRDSGVAFEVRTTVHPLLTSPATLRALARELSSHRIARWTLQPFRSLGCDDEQMVGCGDAPSAIDPSLVRELSALVSVDVRG